jgi:hypothetical protein
MEALRAIVAAPPESNEVMLRSVSNVGGSAPLPCRPSADFIQKHR